MADFADIIGQKQMIDHLQNALRTGKASHAYIITGEKESGKEFIARIFAQTGMKTMVLLSLAISVIPAFRQIAPVTPT